MRVLKTRLLSEALGLSRTTLNRWCRDGTISLEHQPSGKRGDTNVLTLVESVAVGAARAVRKANHSPELAKAVAGVVLGHSEEDLREAMADGRCYVFVPQELPCPRLCSLDAIEQNPEVSQLIRECAEAGITVSMFAVDLQPVWRQVMAVVQPHERAPEPAADRPAIDEIGSEDEVVKEWGRRAGRAASEGN